MDDENGNERLTLLAVHAHPDDEVFGTGGVLARAADEGIHTVLICSTGGEVGEIHDPDLDPDEARGRLAQIREQELRRACAILNVAELHFLGYRDSGMVGTPDNADPRNFHNADPTEAAGRVARIIRQARPQVVVTYNPYGGYGHPDHIAAHHAAVAAFDMAADPACFPEQLAEGLAPWQAQKLYYTAIPRSGIQEMGEIMRERGIDGPFSREDVDLTDMTTPDDEITTRVDVGDYVAQKRAALQAHRTQIGAEHFMMLLPEDISRRILSAEMFVRARSLVEAPIPEDDLFSGIR